MFESKTVRALAWSAALAFSLTGVAQAQRGYARQVSLSEGTVLRAELNDPISSTNSRPGERFTGTIRTDTELPSGTEVVGRVVSVRRATESQPATVDVEFTALRMPDGRSYPIEASLTSLDANNVRRNASGRLEARRSSSSRDKGKFIGYGAGAGALIGVLSGGNLLKSALLGAAAGYLYGQLNKDKSDDGRYSEVNLKPGTEFGVLMERDTRLAVNDDRFRRSDDRYPADDRSTRYDSRYDSRYRDRTTRYDDRTTGSFDRYRNDDVRVLVNGQNVRFGNDRPFMSNGRVMVPLAAVLSATDLHHNYDSRDRQVTVWGERGEVRFTVGESDAWVDGRRVRLDAPAQRIDNVIYVPVQLLEEAADMRAVWDAENRTLRLTTSTRTSFPRYDR